MNNLSVNHLTGIKDLTREDIELIFKTADCGNPDDEQRENKKWLKLIEID